MSDLTKEQMLEIVKNYEEKGIETGFTETQIFDGLQPLVEYWVQNEEEDFGYQIVSCFLTKQQVDFLHYISIYSADIYDRYMAK